MRCCLITWRVNVSAQLNEREKTIDIKKKIMTAFRIRWVAYSVSRNFSECPSDESVFCVSYRLVVCVYSQFGTKDKLIACRFAHKTWMPWLRARLSLFDKLIRSGRWSKGEREKYRVWGGLGRNSVVSRLTSFLRESWPEKAQFDR